MISPCVGTGGKNGHDKMIIVTGGMGFVGSNIIRALNKRSRSDIVAVDDLTDGCKFTNLVDCEIVDYLDAGEFRSMLREGTLKPIPEVIFHNGACSTTMEKNGKYMMDTNFTASKEILHYCQKNGTQLIYASSAAVYGKDDIRGSTMDDWGSRPEQFPNSSPLNVYGYSKLLFDRYVQCHWEDIKSQVVGLRYYNVYGPREQHKGSMASIVYQMSRRLTQGENITLFGENDGYAAGTRSRDFIHVDDVAKVNLWFFEHPSSRGIFDVGTGRSEKFLDVAQAVSVSHGIEKPIKFVPFPESLKGHYQSYTRANIRKLREAGYDKEFMAVAEGVKHYIDYLLFSNT